MGKGAGTSGRPGLLLAGGASGGRIDDSLTTERLAALLWRSLEPREGAVVGPFREAERPFSNFWPATVVHEGVEYPTVEHAYVAAKTLDTSERRLVARLRSPGRAKRAGSTGVTVGPDEGRESGRRFVIVPRPDWDDVKLGIMLDLTRAKYRDAALAELLLATGRRPIEEINDHGDRVWGTCEGEGSNLLGLCLMTVRQELLDERAGSPAPRGTR